MALVLPFTGQATVDAINSGNTSLATIASAGATAAKQDTGNASLSSIDGKTAALISGEVPVRVGNFPSSTTVSGSVSVSNFPAVQPINDNGGSITVDGMVAISNLPTTQDVSGSVVSVSNFPASQTVSGSVSVSNLPTTQPVSGSVSVSNFPAAQTVSGSVSISNFPTTQAVSGSIGVSGSVSVTNLPSVQPINDNGGSITVDGSVSISNFPATQPVSGTFFQTTQPVSGSVSVSNFPSSQAVTGTFFQATQPVSGTFFQTTQPVSVASLPLPAGAATETTLAAQSAKLPASLGAKTSANSMSVVQASDYSATANLDTFDRMKNKRLKDTEEARYDIPVSLISGAIYMGIATAGTATSASSWSITKTSFDANGNPSREQIKTAVIWDNRASLSW